MDRSVTDLYRSHVNFVECVLRRSGVAVRDLGDATQDVFVVAHRRLDEFEGRSSPRTWLYRIAWNVASEYRRRAFRRRELLEDPDPSGEAPSAHEALERQRSLYALLDAIEQLEADKREALICHELEEQPMHVVAKRLGIPLKTAFSRLYAARRALKLELQRQGWTCAPMFAWPFARVLDRGVQPIPVRPLRWGVSAARAVAAFAFAGLAPVEPAAPVLETRAAVETAPQLALVATEALSRAQPVIETGPTLVRPDGAPKRRARAAATATARPIEALEPAEHSDLTVIRAGRFDLGAGPFGESPLADPPFVEPHRHPRAVLGR